MTPIKQLKNKKVTPHHGGWNLGPQEQTTDKKKFFKKIKPTAIKKNKTQRNAKSVLKS